LFLVVFFCLLIFVASESRSQKSVNDCCTSSAHLFLCAAVFWLNALENFLAGKISFLPLRYPFLTNHRKSFMDSSVWGGGTLKHPRFIFPSSLVQKIPRVEWYLISVYFSRLFVFANCVFVT